MLADLIRYIPGLAKLAYQGQIKSIETKRKYADDTYKVWSYWISNCFNKKSL